METLLGVIISVGVKLPQLVLCGSGYWTGDACALEIMLSNIACLIYGQVARDVQTYFPSWNP